MGWTLALVGTAPSSSETGLAFLAAALGAALLSGLLLRRVGFLVTLRHELLHALVTVLTGGRIEELRATSDAGGVVRYRGGFRPAVAMAPYVLPLEALVVVVVDGFYRGGETGTVPAVATGALVGWHLANVASDTWGQLLASLPRRGESTVRRAVAAVGEVRRNFVGESIDSGDSNDFMALGRAPSVLWIVLSNLFLLGALFAMANSGLDGLQDLGQRFVAAELDLVERVRAAVAGGESAAP